MSSLLKGKGGVLLAGTRPPSDETADLWMIRLRWVAILGMLGTIVAGKRLVPALPLVELLAVLAVIAVINVFWMLWRRRSQSPGARAQSVAPQIAVDVLALTVMLWLTGGVDNPFAAFLTFQIVLAGLLTSATATLGVTGLALCCVGALSFAPPLPLDSAPMGEARVLHLANLMAMAALSAFSGFFIFVFTQRLAELRRDSERNAKLAMLGRLVGGMSHELNTPLATILLASKDLVAVGKESRDAEVQQLAATIAGEAERAADIIGLMRGQIRAGAADKELDVAAFVSDETNRVLDRLGFAGTRLVSAPGPMRHRVHEAGVAQVLRNLLENAVQALAGRAQPRIEVTVRELVRQHRLEISVIDNGPGIDPELLDRLGEPFSTTKEGEGGMGLGLYLSGLLAERMGGALAVELPDGGGTRVTLSLATSTPTRP